MNSITLSEVVNINDVKKIVTLDAPKVSTSDKYTESNLLAYYVAVNSWLLLIRDYTGYAHIYVGDAIMRHGLLDVIKSCQQDADLVIRGELGNTSAMCQSIHTDILSYRHVNIMHDDSNIGKDPTVTLLFLLRYLKRFSPSENDVIKRSTLQDFIATENRNKQLQRKEYSQFVIEHVRAEIMDMYPWDQLCDRIEARDPSDLRFSGGAGYDSKPMLGSKLDAIARHPDGVSYFPQPFGARMLDIPKDIEPTADRIVRVTAVPKSYKASRIIAMEDTYRLAQAKDIEYIFREYDSRDHQIALEDQSINQEYARLGSVDGFYATLDASHASDTISKSLFASLFPNRYVTLVTPLMGNVCEIDGQLRTMQMSSTSGHALTFRHETIVYKAIALAADRLYCTLTGEGSPFAWAYGDDTIIPSRSVDLATEFFNRLGLVINQDKSFWGTEVLYRESCGEEYMCGQRLTTVFFPRFPVVGQITGTRVSLDKKAYNDEYRGKLDNSLTMLIDLQKKLFPFSRSASTFVYQVVLAAYPKMTSSPAGTVCTDLWGYQDTGVARRYYAYAIAEDAALPYRYQRLASRHFERLTTLPLSQAAAELWTDAASRETMHYCPVVKYVLDREPSASQIARYDMYRYQEFLKYGPRYADPLSELLGVSESPIPIDHIYGRKELDIRLR
jgi:hypothetical protein